MDLQLGLGISSSSSSSSTDEFNFYGGIQNQPQMDGGGGNGSFSYSCNLEVDTNNRFLDQTFDEMNSNRSIPPTLSLLVWDQNHHTHIDTDTNSLSLEYSNKDDNGDVGWPPISARRKRMYNQNRGEENGGGENGIGTVVENTLFVKVKMEGEGIGRKVDLSLHYSLQSLLQTLVVMFGKCEESVQSYKLVYQDEMGFWKLAEEDSWGTLIRSACRLRLMRNNY